MTATAASVAPPADARATTMRLSRVLALVVLLAAAAVRFALAWAHVTPVYFPDEYRYAALARSLGHLDGPTIRGHSAHFPALLQPLLTAPLWRVAGLETGYRLVQALESVALTLAAVPVFLLARRLRLSTGAAIAVSALTLLVPDGIFAGFVLSEPIAYPLVLAAVAVGVSALVQPRRRTQAVFVGLSLLAAAARVQFVVLPVCYLLAALVVAVRERRLQSAAREQWPVAAVVALAAVAVLARGPSKALGYYSGVLHTGFHPIAALDPLGRNLLILLYAGGWILIPGALLGLALALTRPRSRTELAFGALATVTGLAVVLEATFLGETQFAQERYFFYVFPLLALSFCLYASRGWPLRRVHALLAAGALLLAGLEPLSRFAQDRTAGHSPFLLGLEWLELKLGNGDASLALALVAALLAVVAVACSMRPQRGTTIALGAALCFCTASSAAAWAYDRANTSAALHRYLPATRSWVDATHAGPVTLVSAPGGSIGGSETQLFWNPSVQRVAVLPGAIAPDDRAADAVRIGADGTLLAAGRPLTGPLLVDGHGATVVLRDARRVAAARSFTLWRPAAAARLALYVPGRGVDGAISPQGAIVVWPSPGSRDVRGWLELTVRTPRTSSFTLTSPRHGLRRTYRTPAGRPVHVRVAACSASGHWSTSFAAPLIGQSGTRFVAGTASVPRFVPDASACAARRR